MGGTLEPSPLCCPGTRDGNCPRGHCWRWTQVRSGKPHRRCFATRTPVRLRKQCWQQLRQREMRAASMARQSQVRTQSGVAGQRPSLRRPSGRPPWMLRRRTCLLCRAAPRAVGNGAARAPEDLVATAADAKWLPHAAGSTSSSERLRRQREATRDDIPGLCCFYWLRAARRLSQLLDYERFASRRRPMCKRCFIPRLAPKPWPAARRHAHATVVFPGL